MSERWVEVRIGLGGEHGVRFTLPEPAYRDLHGVMLTAPGDTQVESSVRYVEPPTVDPGDAWEVMAAHLSRAGLPA